MVKIVHLKRGSYFFVLDVFIASSILILTLIMIFSTRVNTPPSESTFRSAEDIMNYLSTTELRDTNNPQKLNLTRGGFVNDSSLTLLQIIGLLNYTHSKNASGVPWSNIFIGSVCDGIVPAQYGLRIKINGAEVYTRSQNKDSYDTAQMILVSKRLVTFQVNDSAFYGPEIIALEVWN